MTQPVLITISALLIVFFVVCSIENATANTGPAHDKVVVCYLAAWAVYRPGKGSYSLDHFDPTLCTHVVYAFSGLDYVNNTIKSLDPWQDLKDNYGRGGYEKLTGMKKNYPHLKVTLAIGGWNEGSANYSRMVADPMHRRKFAKQALEFVRKYNFDGLDLDWEYPTQRGGKPEDRQNFVSLVMDLRAEFKPHNLLITSAIGASYKVIDEAYDVKTLSNLLDFLHIMCYDYGGSWDKKVGANSPIKSETLLNVEYTIKHLIALGASPSKLVLGLPFYGRTFVASGLSGNYGDPSDEKGFPGPYTNENGFMGYNEMCTALNDDNSTWTVTWDNFTGQAIARNQDIENHQTKVVTYDNTRAIANKIRYAMRQNLAGAMVWSVDTDDFLGECSPENDTFIDYEKTALGIKLTIPRRVNNDYPLLRTINEAIILSLAEIDQENELKKKEEENIIVHGSANCNRVGILIAFILIFRNI